MGGVEALVHHISFGVYLLVILLLCLFMLGVSFFLGGRYRGRAKNDPFESGVVSVGGARLRLSAKFYLVAMCCSSIQPVGYTPRRLIICDRTCSNHSCTNSG